MSSEQNEGLSLSIPSFSAWNLIGQKASRLLYNLPFYSVVLEDSYQSFATVQIFVCVHEA